MKRNINKNLIIICLLSVFLTTVSVTLIYYQVFQNRIRTDLKTSLELLKSTGYFQQIDNDTSKFNIRTDDNALRVTWINSDGKVLYDNDTDADKLENHLSRKEIEQAFETGYGESVRNSDTMNMSTYYYAELLNNGTVLRVASDARSITALFMFALPMVLSLVLLIIIFCVWLSQLLTKQLLNPVEEMIDNIDDPDLDPEYEELLPFVSKIHNQYEQIIKMAAVREEFSANVSHELKTPLTSISGYAELIETDQQSTDQQKHFAHEIVRNASRLQSLIDDTIFISELDNGDKPQMELIDLNDVVKSCVSDLMVNAENRNIKLTYQGKEAEVSGNRSMLYQLTQNLIQNAIMYNHENGNVNVSVNTDHDRVTLTVEDDGIGIPEKDQQRIFERFYRVDKSRSKSKGGTGLGLAIVKHIAEVHDGEIALTSREEEGTKITVSFPLAE